MSRLKKHKNIPVMFGGEPLPGKLTHQPDYGQTPWKPGDIPSMRNGSRIPVYGGIDDKPTPYGEVLGVQLPANIGEGYSPVQLVDVEGHETKRKQTSGAHGGKPKV
jgi:hypothetical protein